MGRVDEGHQLAFVGHLQGVQPEERAGRRNSIGHRHSGLVDLDADSCGTRDLDERRHEPTAGGITDRVHRPRIPCLGRTGEHRRDQPVQRRAVGAHLGAEVDTLTHAEDRHPVLADRAGQDHHVAGACTFGPDVHTGRYHADAGGVDEQLVGAALSNDFGVAGDDRHAGLFSGPPHGGGDRAQHVELEPFLEDETRGEGHRLRATARQIVDGAVDREMADVAPREEQWLHHIRVRGQRDAAGTDVQQRRVTGRPARRSECRHEQVLDELLGQHSPAAVAQHDPPGLAQRQRTDPVGGVDGDRLFRHARRSLSAMARSRPPPAGGIGSTPRTRLRWRPWWRPTAYAVCTPGRTPGTRGV